MTATESGSVWIGGILIVHGDVDGAVGTRMKGGSIEIFGDVDGWLARRNPHNVGMEMTGGEIHIHGRISNIGDVLHGKIFHKRKLIVDK